MTAQGVHDLVFAVRQVVPEHWYANFGYYAADGDSYFGNANKLYRDGGRLCRLHLASGQVTVRPASDLEGTLPETAFWFPGPR